MPVSMSELVTQWGKGNSLSAYLSLPCHPNGTLSPDSLPISMSSFANQYATIQAGGGVVTTLAGSALAGSTDGQGTAATFNHPQDVAVTSSGIVYVADTQNNLIRKITPLGLVSTLLGGLTAPYGVAVDTAGYVYATSSGNGYIYKISPTGVGSTFATGFTFPYGIAVDSSGYVYVTDTSTNNVYKITPGGSVSTFATGFTYPVGVTVDTAGYVYVTELGDIRKITPGGSVSTFATGFTGVNGIEVDSSGYVYVSDPGANKRIIKVTPLGVVSIIAGALTGSSDGTGFSARFGISVAGVTVDPLGNVYVADTYNNKIRKIT